MKLLICITYHHTSDQHLKNLFFNLQNIKDTYKCQYNVVIHVNSEQAKQLILMNFSDTEVHVANSLSHPFALTWQHRQYMKDHINDYDVFMYIEDDMLIKYEQLTNYLKNFELMWPDYKPSFIRYEVNDEGERYSLDQKYINLNIITIGNKRFCKTNHLYCACWILPAKTLKDKITDEFTQMIKKPCDEVSREEAASFVSWSLVEPALLELERDKPQISELCTIHHISNKYIKFPVRNHFSVTKLTDIFKKEI